MPKATYFRSHFGLYVGVSGLRIGRFEEIFPRGSQGDAPVNAMFSRPIASGEYFEVTCESGKGAFLGLGTEKAFAQGYKCRGLFFGGPGNLANGSGLLKGGFGEGAWKHRSHGGKPRELRKRV